MFHFKKRMYNKLMPKIQALRLALFTFGLLIACVLPFGVASPTPAPTDTALPTETFTLTASATLTETASPFPPTETPTPIPWPTGVGDCTLNTTGPTTIYERPDFAADVFFEENAGFETLVTGRTDDGWVGFDPGIPQAANMGPFHLRWFFFDQISLSGDCLSVPVFWGPEPGVCYDMPMESVPVFTQADASSPLLTTLEVGEFAAVTGVSGTGWAKVDLGQGNTGLTGAGWVDQSTLNVNGPCENLPTVSP